MCVEQVIILCVRTRKLPFIKYVDVDATHATHSKLLCSCTATLIYIKKRPQSPYMLTKFGKQNRLS